MKKLKYALGGDLLKSLAPAALSFIPGGAAFAPLVNPLLGLMDQNVQNPNIPPPQFNSNPYGQFALGGPLLPIQPMAQESTFVNPVPFLQPILPQTFNTNPGYPIQAMTQLPGYDPTSSGSSKSKTKPRFREMKLGGFVNDGFKQFDTGSHQSGNDQTIDQHGNLTLNGQASVQNTENMYNGFVMSDTLTNPKTGNKFSTDAKNVNQKYKNARLSDLDKNTLDFEMGQLQALNLKKKEKLEQGNQLAFGGYPGDPVPLTLNGTNPLSSGTMQDLSLGNTFLQSNYSTDGADNNAGDPTQVVAAPDGPQVVKPGNNNWLNAIGLGLKGAALAGSVVDAFRKPEVETPILPDYSKADKNIYGATLDYTQARQDAQGVSNQQSNAIRSASNNLGQYFGRQSGRLSQLQDVLSRIDEQQANGNSQLSLQRGQYENNKALTNTQILTQNRINNQQNAANGRFFDRSLFSDLSQIGTQFGEEAKTQDVIKNQKQMNKFNNTQIMAVLNAKNPNWQLNPDLVSKFEAGSLDINDILKYTQ